MAERFFKNGVSGWFDITDNMLRCLAVQSFADAVTRQNGCAGIYSKKMNREHPSRNVFLWLMAMVGFRCFGLVVDFDMFNCGVPVDVEWDLCAGTKKLRKLCTSPCGVLRPLHLGGVSLPMMLKVTTESICRLQAPLN